MIGSTQGGQLIRLEGTGFLREEISVTICEEECILLSDRSSATELYCVTPTVNGMFQNAFNYYQIHVKRLCYCYILLTHFGLNKPLLTLSRKQIRTPRRNIIYLKVGANEYVVKVIISTY